MKKWVLALMVCMILSVAGFGQARSLQASNFNPRVDSVVEQLVDMAMNNSQVRSVENTAGQFKYNYLKSKTMWLNSIVLMGNLNEYSIKTLSGNSNGTATNLYPKYNVGVILPVGLFINNGRQTKSDWYKYQATIEDVNTMKATMRATVISTYHDFLMDRELMDLGQQVVNDWQIIYAKAKEKFTNGEITLDSFYSTTRIYHDELAKQITLQDALKTAEAKLEALIGMNIYDALDMIRNKAQDNAQPVYNTAPKPGGPANNAPKSGTPAKPGTVKSNPSNK